MVNSMILNNRISIVMGISIFGFKKYWHKVFNLMELNMSPTLKQFLQAETVNADKKAYYQQYDVKRARAFYKQEMMKQKIYENILVRRSEIDYSLVICFEIVSLKWTKHKHSPRAINRKNRIQTKKREWCGSIEHLRITSMACPVGIEMSKSKIGLGDGAI